ncbi:MAG: cache domain-containing protein, partial [Gammaproteobacteria bacterium]|nr:cache domain-containing protein [Gammaproteobacteria bacterium]
MKIINKFPARSGLIFLSVFFIFSIFLVIKYVDTERQRDLASWQSRLGMLADLHRSAIEGELHMRRETLRELAENPTLQLYLSQYNSTDNKSDIVLAAQQSHVRNLLAATAERMGFNLRQDSSVNLTTSNDYGIAIVNQSGSLLITSKGFTKDMSVPGMHVKNSLQSGSTSLVNLFNSESGQPVYGYVMPVFQLQNTQSGQATGAVVMLLDPRQGLFNKLKNTHLDT